MMIKNRSILKQTKSKQYTVGAIIIFVLLLLATLASMMILITPSSVKAYPGEIITGNVSWYNWDAKGQTYGDDPVCRVNSSEYYLIAYSGATDHGYVSTLHVWDSNGTIQQSVVSTWEFSSASVTYYISVRHIPNTDKYVLAYEVGTASSIMTIQVWDSNGTINPSAIDTQALSSNGGEYVLLNITQNVWVVAYQQSTTDDGFIESWWIDNTGVINNSQLDIQEFAPVQGTHPVMCIVDTDTVVLSYVSSSAPSALTMDTYNITDSGIITDTPADTWKYDNNSVGSYGRVEKIGSDKYCFVSINLNNNLMANTTTIDDAGMITKNWIDYLMVENGDAITTFSTFFVDNPNTFGALGVMGLVCRGVGTGENDGYMFTWNVSNDGSLGSSIASSYEFETKNILAQTFPYVTWISGSWYLNIYCDATGLAQTLNISTTAPTPPGASVYSIDGLTNNRVDWAGIAGETVWSNSTGTSSETLVINMSVNSSDNVSDIRIWVGNLNDTVSWINASNISIYVSSDNSNYGILGTFTDGGSNLTINSTTWNAGTMGATPFILGGITNADVNIYCRFKLAIPISAETYSYYNTDTWYIYIGHYA